MPFSLKKTLLLSMICAMPVTGWPKPAASSAGATPTIRMDLSRLPAPHLEEHAGWEDMYYRAFEIAYSKVQYGTPENGFVEAYMDEAFSANIFQWDTSFIMMFGRYGNGELPSIVSLENFYRYQHKDGWIGRELREKDGSSYWPKSGSLEANCSINPPLFSWAEWQSYQVTGDKARFTKLVGGKPIVQILVDYFDWIKANRRWENGLYWTTSYANGMDRSPRLGTKDVCEHANGSWIDISAQQALNALYIAKIASAIGDQALAERFTREHQQLKTLINETLWDEQDGFYYDKNAKGEFYKVKTPASFWVWVAEITDEKHNAQLINEHLTNPKRFWTQHHIPTVAADEATYHKDGGYWDGAIWAPTTYQTIKGLEAQGYHNLAHKIAANHLENLYWVYRQSNTLYENYKPEAAAKGVEARPDFVGWTGTGPIAGLIENILGITVNAAEDSLTWRLHLAEEHGISQLKFGDNTVSLLAEDRLHSNDGTWINVTANSPFLLNVVWGEQQQSQRIAPGKTRIRIGKPEHTLHRFSLVHKGMQPQAFGETALYQTFIVQEQTLRTTDIKIANLQGSQQGILKAAIYKTDQTTSQGKPTGKPIAEQKIAVKDLPRFFDVVNLQWQLKDLAIGKHYALVLSAEDTEIAEPLAWLTGEEINGRVHFGKMVSEENSANWQADFAAGDGWLKVYFTEGHR